MEEQLAEIDPLTGALNTRAFIERATREISRSRRHGRPLSLAYMDLDNFKAVNDTKGHAQGDEVLRKVVSTLKSRSRAQDLVARLGGDEFVILFAETDSKGASQAVENLQQTLTKAMEQEGWPVTFSIGLLTHQKPPTDLGEIITTADNLMYGAKKSGKNQVRHLTLDAKGLGVL